MQNTNASGGQTMPQHQPMGFNPTRNGRNMNFNARSQGPRCFACDGDHLVASCPLLAQLKAQKGSAAPDPATTGGGPELTSTLSQLKEVLSDISLIAKDLKKPPEPPPPPPPPPDSSATLDTESSLAWSRLAATTKELKELAVADRAAVAKLSSTVTGMSKVVRDLDVNMHSANTAVTSLTDAVSEMRKTLVEVKAEVTRVDAKASRAATALRRDVNGLLAGKPTRTKVRTPRSARDPDDAPAVAAAARGRATALGRRQRSPPARYRGEGDTEAAAPAPEFDDEPPEDMEQPPARRRRSVGPASARAAAARRRAVVPDDE